MNALSKLYDLLLKPLNRITDEPKRRTLAMGTIAVLATLFVATSDGIHHLIISAILGYTLASCFVLLIFIDYKGWNIDVKVGYVLIFDLFTILKVFAEGLQLAGYLFFLVAIVAIAFLLDKNGKHDRKIGYYIITIILSFCGSVIFAPQTSAYQAIPAVLVHQMFVTNCVVTVTLISVLTYVGINMEEEVREDLVKQKRRAEAHEKKILLQNTHLKEIAFMSVHSVRSPLTNIMSITQLINVDAITNERDRALIEHLRRSSLELDSVIHDIVAKTASADIDIDKKS